MTKNVVSSPHHAAEDIENSVTTSSSMTSSGKNDSSHEHHYDHHLHLPFLSERWWKFIFLVTGIMFFFGCHNYMQELIMKLPGFTVRTIVLLFLPLYQYFSLCRLVFYLVI